MRRGFSPIDLLMLVLLLSVGILAISAAASNEPLQFLAIRSASLHDQRTLHAALERPITLYNSSGVALMRGRVVDVISFLSCNGCPGGEDDYCNPLVNATNATLFAFNKFDRHYLMQITINASGGVYGFSAYNNDSNVCLETVPLARFSHNTTCGAIYTIAYASWLPWQQVQRC